MKTLTWEVLDMGPRAGFAWTWAGDPCALVVLTFRLYFEPAFVLNVKSHGKFSFSWKMCTVVMVSAGEMLM